MRLFTITLLTGFLAAQQLLAQLPTPELDTIYPPGGQAGKTVQVDLTGTDLDDLTALTFTHPGITATPVILSADEIWPEARQDGLKFTLNIAADVPAGLYEARTAGKYGISTPRFFTVSPKDGPEEITIAGGNETPETATVLAFNQPVNAQTTASQSDHYKVAVKQGQRVLVQVWGERIDSRIDASVTVLDPAGNPIAESLNEIGLDPLGDFTADADGDYIIKVSDYLFNGGGQNFYRMMATTAPHIDGVFPLAGLPGTKQKFTVYGRNIPGGSPGEGLKTANGDPLETKEVEIQIPATGEPVPVDGSKALQLLADGFGWKDGDSNPVRIGLAKDAVVVEDPKIEEQTVTTPCEVAGRFDYSGDMDLFRFTAKKDETYFIEVISDRMAVGADPNIIVQQIVKPAPDAEDQKETSKFVAESDDIVLDSQRLVGFDTKSRDVNLSFKAAVDGEYRVIIGNNFSSSGPLAAYRLGIRPARPGFKLIAVADNSWQEANNGMPGVPTVNAGGSTFIRVLALRQDGFDGAIALSTSGLPVGVTAPATEVWQGNTEAYFVVSAASNAQDWVGEVEITGTAKVGEQDVTVKALPGTLTWSAVDTTKARVRSRLTGSFPLAVTSKKAWLGVEPAEAKVWQVEINQPLDIPVKLTKAEGVKGNITVTPYGLPNFKKPAPIAIPEKDAEGVVKISFNPDGNNKPMVSEGVFVLKADGVMGKYQTNPEAVARWTAWQKAIDANTVKLTAAKTKADAAAAAATAAQTAADKAVADNATAQATLVKATADAQAKFDAAKAAVTAADAALKPIPDAALADAKKALADNAAAKPVLAAAAAAAKTKADAATAAATAADAALTAAVTAHAENIKKLSESKTAAATALKADRDALAAAEKALADQETSRVPLANTAAEAEVKAAEATRAAAMAASAITSAATNHEANIKFLTEAQTKADAATTAPDAAAVAAKKVVTDKETAKAVLVKNSADAQTKLDAAKKAATDAATALTVAAAAHAENVKKLTAAKTAVDAAVTAADAALAAADKAVADNKDEAAKPQLAQAAADAKTKADAAKKAAADAAAAITAAATANTANVATLTAAKTAADAAAKAAEPGLAAAQKAVTDADAALVPLVKAATEAQAKADEIKKVATDLAAQIAAVEKANTENVAAMTAAKAAADPIAAAAEAAFAAAQKPVTHLDAAKAALEKAVADALAKIEPAEKALAAAEAPILAAETAHAPNLAKLTAAKDVADLAAKTAGMALAVANQAVTDNAAPVAALTKAVTDAEVAAAAATKAEADKLAALKTAADAAAVASAKAESENAPNKADLVKASADAAKALTDADAAQKAAATANTVNVAKLTAAKVAADAALKAADTALAAAKLAQAANEAAKPALVATAADAKAKADAAKAEATAAAALVTKATAAKTLAAAELKKATDRAKEKDVKFTVFSHPIQLRIVDAPVVAK